MFLQVNQQAFWVDWLKKALRDCIGRSGSFKWFLDASVVRKLSSHPADTRIGEGSLSKGRLPCRRATPWLSVSLLKIIMQVYNLTGFAFWFLSSSKVPLVEHSLKPHYLFA
jgi:hypothetical protein